MGKCLKYYADADGNGYPIGGTMRGYVNYQCGCNMLHLPDSQMSAPAGQVACTHPEGLRFWYRVDRAGKILPNSLFISKGRPTNLSGSCLLEFIKYCNE